MRTSSTTSLSSWLEAFDPMESRVIISFVLLLVLKHPAAHGQISNATCTSNATTSFLFDPSNESPCVIWSKLQSLCIPTQTINVPPLLDRTYAYNPPGREGSACQCNVVAYNLMAARNETDRQAGCSWCQLGNTSNWLTEAAYRQDCPSYKTTGLSFTENVVGIPAFALKPWQDARWEPSAALAAVPQYTSSTILPPSITLSRSFLPLPTLSASSNGSTSTSATHTTILSSSSHASPPNFTVAPSPNGQTPPSTSSKVNWGAIIGGTVGGVATLILLILLIVFCLQRRQRDKEVRQDDPANIVVTYRPNSTSPKESHKDQYDVEARDTVPMLNPDSDANRPKSFLNLFGPTTRDRQLESGAEGKSSRGETASGGKRRRSKRSELFHDPRSFFSPRPAPKPTPAAGGSKSRGQVAFSSPLSIQDVLEPIYAYTDKPNSRKHSSDIDSTSIASSQRYSHRDRAPQLPAPVTGAESPEWTDGFRTPYSYGERDLVDKVMKRQRTQGRFSVGWRNSRNSRDNRESRTSSMSNVSEGYVPAALGGTDRVRSGGKGATITPDARHPTTNTRQLYPTDSSTPHRHSIPEPKANRPPMGSTRQSYTYSGQIPSIILTSLPPTPTQTSPRASEQRRNSTLIPPPAQRDRSGPTSRGSHAITLPPPPHTPAHDFSLPPEEYRRHQSTHSDRRDSDRPDAGEKQSRKQGLEIQAESLYPDQSESGVRSKDTRVSHGESVGGEGGGLLPSPYDPPTAAPRFSPSGRSSFPAHGDGTSTIIDGYGNRTSYASTDYPDLNRQGRRSELERISPVSRYTTHTERNTKGTGKGIEYSPLPPVPEGKGKDKADRKSRKKKEKTRDMERDNDEHQRLVETEVGRKEAGRRSTEGRKKKKKRERSVKG